MKTLTPVRRSRSSRPNTAGQGDGVPVTASMELLPPEAASSPSMSGAYSGELSGRQSTDLMAMGAPASLQQGSRSITVRRSLSAQARDPPQVVLLNSTRPVAESTNMQVGILLQQMPHPSSSSSGPLLASNNPLNPANVNRTSINRYATSGTSLTASVPSAGALGMGTAGGGIMGGGGGVRPLSSASSTASMLVGGIPGPLPTATPGMMSRLWTPESCIGSEVDDSANTRAGTASSQVVRGGRETSMTPDSIRGSRVQGRAGYAHVGGVQGQESFEGGDEAEYYKYLESRRATDAGHEDDDDDDDDAFRVPDYDHLSVSRQSMRHHPHDATPPMTPLGMMHDDDDAQSQPPGTPTSVASGVVRGSGIFFTALRRSLGGNDGTLGAEESMMSARSAAPTEAMSMFSHANPMQEPSHVPSTHGDGEGPHEVHGAGEDMGSIAHGDMDQELTDYLTGYDVDEDGSKSVWDNPVQTPRETSAVPSEEPSRASFLSLLKGLYSDTGATGNTGGEEDPGEGASMQGEEDADENGSQGVGSAGQPDDDVRVSAGAMEETAAAQQSRREELHEYLAGWQSKLDEDGHALVELPKNYQVLVEQLLMAKRAEYASLAGWLGPRKFSELPINQLPDSHDDPKVQEGLNRIRALDMRLAEKEAEMIIMARERDPEGWAVAEKARLARKAQAVEEALKRERMRRMRAAKLQRALTTPEGGEGTGGDDVRASTAFSTTSSRMGPSQRLLALRPDEEALVEAILKRDEKEEDHNPFEFAYDASLPPDTDQNPRSASDSNPPGDNATTSEADTRWRPPALLLALSGLPGLQGEASAAQLLKAAQQVAAGLAAQATSASFGVDGTAGNGRNGAVSGGATPDRGSGDVGGGGGGGVDLAAGLAFHTQAMLRAQQAAVAGMPLGAINAHLEQFVQEHNWTADGSLADFTSVSAVPPVGVKDTAEGSTSVGPGGHHQAGQGRGVPGGLSEAAAAARPGAAASVVGSAAGNSQKRDYLREEREAKELLARETDLDQRIRAFKLSDPRDTKRLSSDQIAALVNECKIMKQRAKQQQHHQQHQGPGAAQTVPDIPTDNDQPPSARPSVAGTPKQPLQMPQPSPAPSPGPVAAGRGVAKGRGISSTGPDTALAPQQTGTSTSTGGSGMGRGIGAPPVPRQSGSYAGSVVAPIVGTASSGVVSGAHRASSILNDLGGQALGAGGPCLVSGQVASTPGLRSTSASSIDMAVQPNHQQPQQVVSGGVDAGMVHRIPSAGRRAGSGKTGGGPAHTSGAGLGSNDSSRPASGGHVKAGRRSVGSSSDVQQLTAAVDISINGSAIV